MPAVIGRPVFLQKRLVPPKPVQIAQVAGRIQQLLPVMLAVDVQQLPSQLPQLGHGDQPAVHPAHVPTVPLKLPLEQQLLPAGGKPVLHQPGQGRDPGEHRRDQGRTRPGADQLPAGPLPQHRADGVDDDGLARPGLAGEDVEARLKADVRRLNQRDILDMQQGKHCTPSFPSRQRITSAACGPPG